MGCKTTFTHAQSPAIIKFFDVVVSTFRKLAMLRSRDVTGDVTPGAEVVPSGLEIARPQGRAFAPGPVLAVGVGRARALAGDARGLRVLLADADIVAEVGPVVLVAQAVGQELGLGVLAPFLFGLYGPLFTAALWRR